VVGDGSFLMTGNELAIAVERRLPITILLANNGSYGSIRRQQEAEFPGRAVGTQLSVPDFALLGRAFGCTSLVLDREAATEGVLDRALRTAGPVLVEVKTSLAAILPAPLP
jgi:acetolactate synthase-1/2/3 large subunit